MELPSFYTIFLGNILRHMQTCLMPDKKQAPQISCIRPVTIWLPLLLAAFTPIASAEIYPLNALKHDIAKFLANEYRKSPHDRIDIKVGNLDRRLRLARCEDSIVLTGQDKTGSGGNISVAVQCNKGNTWSIHVPAQVTIYREISVAARDIRRGEVINLAHLAIASVNISNIRQTFLADAAQLIGKEATRNIGKGDPFRATYLDAPTAVKRGELVTLESLVGSIKVSSAGTAMADGRIGQKVRVRNNSSERVISGVVVSQGLVQTL